MVIMKTQMEIGKKKYFSVLYCRDSVEVHQEDEHLES